MQIQRCHLAYLLRNCMYKNLFQWSSPEESIYDPLPRIPVRCDDSPPFALTEDGFSRQGGPGPKASRRPLEETLISWQTNTNLRLQELQMRLWDPAVINYDCIKRSQTTTLEPLEQWLKREKDRLLLKDLQSNRDEEAAIRQHYDSILAQTKSQEEQNCSLDSYSWVNFAEWGGETAFTTR